MAPWILLLIVSACSPLATEPPVAADEQPRSGSVPATPAPCLDSNREGLWADDCSTEWCLPRTDLTLVFSVNLGLHMAYSSGPLPGHGAVRDETACSGAGGWRVFRLDKNRIYFGDNLFMVDPVRRCLGLLCRGPVEDGWAVSDPSRYLYFLNEVSVAELLNE